MKLFLESEQSDFIRRLIVTLDERQQYFTSCAIAVKFSSIFLSIVFIMFTFLQQRHYRDFISLLPTQISFAILNHLTLRELTIARRVRWKNKFRFELFNFRLFFFLGFEELEIDHRSSTGTLETENETSTFFRFDNRIESFCFCFSSF